MPLPTRRRTVATLLAGGLAAAAMSACGSPAGHPAGVDAPTTVPPAAVTSPTAATPATTTAPMTTAPTTTAPATTTAPTTTPPTTTPPMTVTPATALAPAPVQAAADGGPGRFGPTAAGPLTGKVVAIDPGHNGGNGANPSRINQPIFNGRTTESCDTTGTETNSGYTEALFNWNVALAATADLRAEGATVVLTRTSNAGVGPCVPQRAAIGNAAHADAALSIHGDGGPPGGRGFAILEPVADGPNNAIIGPSQALGTGLRDAFAAGTGEPVSSYDGVNGITARSDLGGTNLSTVPKVFIECANMRNGTDATLVTSAAWQAQAARAIAGGLTRFLAG